MTQLRTTVDDSQDDSSHSKNKRVMQNNGRMHTLGNTQTSGSHDKEQLGERRSMDTTCGRGRESVAEKASDTLGTDGTENWDFKD